MRQRELGVGALVVTVSTAGCSLLFDAGSFDSNYVDAGDAGLDARDATVDRHDGARDAPTDAQADTPSPTMPLFHYRRLTPNGGDGSTSMLQPGVAFLGDSGVAHPIGCRDPGSQLYFEPATTLGGSALDNGPYRYGQFAMSSFHSPEAGLELAPGSSKFAFNQVIPDAGDGGTDYQLLVADELTDCDASRPATRVDYTGDSFGAGKPHVLPRFSPDGTRVAYLDLALSPDAGPRPSFTRVMTTAVDGTQPRQLRAQETFDPETNIILWGLPPTWIPPSVEGGTPQVVWLDGPDPSCRSIYSGCASPQFRLTFVEDAKNPIPTVVPCPYGPGGFSQIAELAVVPQEVGSLLAMVASAGTLSSSPATGALDIYIADYESLFSAYQCNVFVNATHFGRSGAVARDMAVSPDGNWIAYAANTGPVSTGTKVDGGGADGSGLEGGGIDAGPPVDITSPTQIWLLTPTPDGSGVPIPCGAADPGFDDFGPQWFNGGSLLVWTRAPHPPNAAPDTTGGLWQANVDPRGACTNIVPVLQNGPTKGGTLTVIAPANATNACALGAGSPRSEAVSPLAAWWTALVAAGAIRRRRSSRHSTS